MNKSFSYSWLKMQVVNFTKNSSKVSYNLLKFQSWKVSTTRIYQIIALRRRLRNKWRTRGDRAPVIPYTHNYVILFLQLKQNVSKGTWGCNGWNAPARHHWPERRQCYFRRSEQTTNQPSMEGVVDGTCLVFSQPHEDKVHLLTLS